jgi:hypothetical protein
LGVDVSKNSSIDAVFDIIAHGSSTITIDNAVAYLAAFNGPDATWDQTEFETIIAKLEAGPSSIFSTLATDGVITTAAIATQYSAADANQDSSLSRAEYDVLAAALGASATDDTKFRTVAGSDKLITLAELTGFANPLGTTASGSTTWTETQFNAVVDALKKS